MRVMNALLICILITVGLLTGLVSASEEIISTGQERTIGFDNYNGYTDNVTIIVPNTIKNESLQLLFTHRNELGDVWGVDSWANITINNITKTVWLSDTKDDWINVSGTLSVYVNYSVSEICLGENQNISIEIYIMDSWTLHDSWYGTIDVVSEADYNLRVLLIGTLLSLLSISIVATMMLRVVKDMKRRRQK